MPLLSLIFPDEPVTHVHKQLLWVICLITIIGWTITQYIKSIQKLQEEQVRLMRLTLTELRTHTRILDALEERFKSTVVESERVATILETQARQLDALLGATGVKYRCRPWMPCKVRFGLESTCESQDHQGRCPVHGPGPKPLRNPTVTTPTTWKASGENTQLGIEGWPWGK